MVTPTAGSVVLVPFPFSDLSQSKRSPSAVLRSCSRGRSAATGFSVRSRASRMRTLVRWNLRTIISSVAVFDSSAMLGQPNSSQRTRVFSFPRQGSSVPSRSRESLMKSFLLFNDNEAPPE